MRSTFIAGIVLALPLMAGPLLADDKNPSPRSIEVDADVPFAATVEGQPAQLQFVSGFVDRLTLNVEYVARHGIKPAAIMGNANVDFWGKREVKGKNRPLEYTIGGVKENGRFLDD